MLGFLSASLAEQLTTLSTWQLPRAGVLLMMNACENRCFFCANPGVTNPPPEMLTRWAKIAAWLGENPSLGVRRLCLVGTEPARHPDFDRTLALGREVGFGEVEVMTSGLRLAERGEARRWADAGVSTVAAPLYAAEPALHDAIVGRSAFEATLAGLDAARDAGIEVRVHTLALTRTLPALAALARWVRDRFGTRLSLAPVRPKEALFAFEQESPSLASLDTALAPIADLGLVGFPSCIARHLPRDSALSMTLYFKGQATSFVEACATCADRPACPGIVNAELPRARVRPR